MGSPAVAMSSPRKSPSSLRRTNKPLVEKKRRARINGCLGQLKSLILSAMKTEGTQVSRLEKADILEMTVKYLRHIQRQQATSSVTSEPEVVAKFSAGYSECAAEVIRYMDSVSGVTPDVRYRLESHLVGRLQGSMAESGVNHGAPPRPDTKPSQIQSLVHDETSIHYQTALELANMASSVKVSEISREDHTNLDMASRQNTQQPKVPLSASYQKEASALQDSVPPVKSTFHQDQILVRAKNNIPTDISNCASVSLSSLSTSSLPLHRGEENRQSTVTATAVPPFINEDIKVCENRSEYFNTAPTPPDTPPYNNNDNDINNNDVTNSSTGGYIYLKEREVYINEAAYGNAAYYNRPSSPVKRNNEVAQREENYAYGRDYVIKHISQDADVEMRKDLDPSDSESDVSLPNNNNSAVIYDPSCQRNYNLTVYQQPLHIHIPDSPTPTTPSPPQLFPSHAIQEQQQIIYNHPVPSSGHQRNNPNAVLPTILYGVRGSDALAISGAIDFRSEQQQPSRPLPAEAGKATDDFNSHPQSTCGNLDETNCSNTADGRYQSQIPIFKQSTWPVATEQAQDSQFQGHSTKHLSQQQRSPSSSPLSPPTLTREDLRPTGARASNESERALEYFDYSNRRTSLCRMRRNSHDNYTNGVVTSSSRRLTFDENGRDAQTNGMSIMEPVAFYRRDPGPQLCSRGMESNKQTFKTDQDDGLNINHKDRICSSSPSSSFSLCHSHHQDQSSPRSSPPHHLHHPDHRIAQEDRYRYSQPAQLNKHHQLYQYNKYPHCNKEEHFSSSFTPFRRVADRADDPLTHHHHHRRHRSSSSSSPTTSSPSSSPPTIVPSHVLAHSQEGMRSLYQETQTSASHHVNTTAGHHLRHSPNNNMNGPAMSDARDLSRQNVSPLSSSTLKRVMMGHGLEVSARPRYADARPAESSFQRIGGQPGVRGQGFAIMRRVPQDTPIEFERPPIGRVPPPIEHAPTSFDERVAMEEESLQATQTTTLESTEERLWRPW